MPETFLRNNKKSKKLKRFRKKSRKIKRFRKKSIHKRHLKHKSTRRKNIRYKGGAPNTNPSICPSTHPWANDFDGNCVKPSESDKTMAGDSLPTLEINWFRKTNKVCCPDNELALCVKGNDDRDCENELKKVRKCPSTHPLATWQGWCLNPTDNTILSEDGRRTPC